MKKKCLLVFTVLTLLLSYCTYLIVCDTAVYNKTVLIEERNSLIDQTLSTVIQIIRLDGTGSGVMIAQDDINVYIVTANHIFSGRDENCVYKPQMSMFNNLKDKRLVSYVDILLNTFCTKTRTSLELMTLVAVFHQKTAKPDIYLPKIIITNEEYDLAILSIKKRSEKKYCIATMYQGELRPFDKILSVSCPYGYRTLMSEGLFDCYDYDENYKTKRMIIASCPIAPGSSGGGIFIKVNGKYELCGITMKIAASTFDFIEHIGIHQEVKYIKKIFETDLISVFKSFVRY